MATTTPRTSRSSRRLIVAGLAVVALAAAAILATTLGADPEPTAGPSLELSLGEGDAMAMCLAFDVSELAKMPVAFEGTVTDVGDEQVTMTVDRWFEGGDAGTVELMAPGGMVALTGGIDFAEGEQYLVTATDGTVNYCGFSGPSTPDLKSSFEEAFPQ